MESRLLDKLKQINADIQKQIPVAINRSHFEYQTTTIEDRLQEFIIQQTYNTKAKLQYYIYAYMNTVFDKWKRDKEKYKNHLLCETVIFSDKLLRDTVPEFYAISKLAHSQAYIELEQTFDQLFAKQLQGETLVLADRNLAYQFKKYDELAEHRAIIEQQINVNTQLLGIDDLNAESIDVINKSNIFLTGLYFDRVRSDACFCEEYTCLALIRICQNWLFKPDSVWEKISINASSDGHTFLVLNRDRNYPLAELAHWGEKAVIVDTWGNFVGTVREVLADPKKLKLYPAEHEWNVDAKFTYKDLEILKNLTTLDCYYVMTGNDVLEKRIPILMEEYQLLSLEEASYAHTREYLYEILKRVVPDNFKLPVKLMLTAAGNELVTVIVGFPEAVIAIHKDFFSLLSPNGMSSTAELEFGIAHAAHYIKQHGVGVFDIVAANQQHLLDKTIVEKNKNGETAIAYLRTNAEFEKNKTARLKLPTFKATLSTIKSTSYEQRIKNLITVLAADASLKGEDQLKTLPNAVMLEMQTKVQFDLLFDHCESYNSSIDKLNYLTMCLDDLWTELLPYELTQQPSIRVREFCKQLYKISINFSDADELQAAEELIKTAYEKRIPAFERIYFAIQNVPFSRDKDKCFLPQKLGVFRQLQMAIDRFVGAQTIQLLQASGQEIINTFKEIKDHFCVTNLDTIANYQLNIYRKNHQQSVPIKLARFFGSRIGVHTIWQTFRTLQINQISWDYHLTCLSSDTNLVIARVLLLLGVNADARIWPAFPTLTLYSTYNHNLLEPSIIAPLTRDLDNYGKASLLNCGKEVLKFLSANHKLDTSMFADNRFTFAAAFSAFYDKNWPALIAPGFEELNLDNDTVNFLLQKFTEIALNGSEEDKLVVKSFFLDRQDDRDFKNLRRAFENSAFISIDHTCKYIIFLLNQEYNKQTFNLFTVTEQINFLNSFSFKKNIIPVDFYIKLFNLPYKDLTLNCLEQLMPLLIKHELNINGCTERFTLDYIKNNKHLLLSLETWRLFNLIVDTTYFTTIPIVLALKSLIWELPSDISSVQLTSSQLILIYRCVDSFLYFPTQIEHEKFNKLVLQKIHAIADLDARMTEWEYLLFTSYKQRCRNPISSVAFCHKAIKDWVADIANKYGKDDATRDYFTRIKSYIVRIFNGVSARDATTVLSQLANAIESQALVSELMGQLIEPEKYYNCPNNTNSSDAISLLAAVSKLFCEQREEQLQLINFLSSIADNKTTTEFATYLIKHNLAKRLCVILTGQSAIDDKDAADQQHYTETAILTLFNLFWDRNLTERSVIIEHLLIPTESVITQQTINKAYAAALEYVIKKLFPNADKANSDDEFAKVFLTYFLQVADKYERNYFLAGMLVASNANQSNGNQLSVGKKLALLCEHMGPAYVKLAQAIHSFPSTPEHLRRDLDHIKGRANPPHRWTVWRMIRGVLSLKDQAFIKFLGPALGSASYNFAYQVTLPTDEIVVLSMLRENAADEARKGFTHLKKTIVACPHPRMQPMRASVLAMLQEAEYLSEIEMSHSMSKLQYTRAKQIYANILLFDSDYAIQIYPAGLINSGEGYRFIELIPGKEFNDLPKLTVEDQLRRKAVAKAIVTVELVTILRGGYFDSDRHGNQLRIALDTKHANYLRVGLYDFGEMGEAVDSVELLQLADVMNSVLGVVIKTVSVENIFDVALAAKIEALTQQNLPTRYLIRVRKALLALHDFYENFSLTDWMDILRKVNDSRQIHPLLQASFSRCISLVNLSHEVFSTKNRVLRFFKSNNDASLQLDVPKEICLK